MASVSNSYNNFSFDLYKHVSANGDGNLFYSPFSIVAAMSMCAAGARKNTEKQLKQVLHYSNLSNEDVHSGNAALHQHLHSLGTQVSLNVANRIFQRNTYAVKQEFIDLLKKYYSSDAQSLDFSNAAATAKAINDWVAGQTNNKIQNLVPEAIFRSPLTKLVLVNAIYFRGDWEMKFNKDMTRPEAFHLSDKSQKNVQMMGITGKKYAHSEPEGLKAAACTLPYAGNQLSMTIVLPNEDSSIAELEASLNASILKAILSNNHKVKVNVFLPKFKFEQKFELNAVLSKLGAPDAFNEATADFSGIKTEDDGLHISNVIHQAVVEVNEEGTEAAAATAIVMMTRCAMVMDFPIDFRCNRPFLFFIHDNKHHTILFTGRYSRPE